MPPFRACFPKKGIKKKGPFSPFGKRPLCHILYPVFTSSNHPQLPQRTDPLAGMHNVADAVVPLIGGVEVRVAAKHHIMKKTGAPICTDAPVCNQTLYELPVDAAFGVVYDLLDFKFVIGHRAKSFLNETMEMVLQVTKNRIIIIL